MLKYSLGDTGKNRKNLKATVLMKVRDDGGSKHSVKI